MSYSKRIHQKFNDETYVGSLDKNNPRVGTGLVGAPECGDLLKIQILVGDNDNIEDVKFRAFGCGSAIASSAHAAERLMNQSLEDAAELKNTEIIEYLNLPIAKHHCSVLAEAAIKAAITDYRAKQALLKVQKKAMFEVTEAAVSYLKDVALKIAQKSATTISDSTIDVDCDIKNSCTIVDLSGTKSEQIYFIIDIESHGCSGTSYAINIATAEDAKRDIQRVVSHGLVLLIEPQAEMLVLGMTVDYEVKDDWEGLVFKNPNETRRCKCGESFYIN